MHSSSTVNLRSAFDTAFTDGRGNSSQFFPRTTVDVPGVPSRDYRSVLQQWEKRSSSAAGIGVESRPRYHKILGVGRGPLKAIESSCLAVNTALTSAAVVHESLQHKCSLIFKYKTKDFSKSRKKCSSEEPLPSAGDVGGGPRWSRSG